MKLEALLQARQQASTASQERNRERYQLALQAGQQALADYHASNFSNRSHLKQACQHFSEALGADRSQVDPMVALGYIFILLDDTPTATRLLTEALRKAPEHADALMFLEFLQLKPQLQAKKANAAPLLAKPNAAQPKSEEVDLDLLYDRTEARLITQVQLISQAPQPQVTVDKEKFLALKQQWQGFQALLEEFRKDIELIDTEIQTDDLQSQLKPLEVIFKRHQQILEHSGILRDLRTRIRTAKKEVEDLLLHLSNHTLPELENLTETYLDHCDAVADQLDDLESQGCPIALLDSDYQNWVAVLEELQDQVDELQK